jgi:hypothetical protein
MADSGKEDVAALDIAYVRYLRRIL